jgi:hypothetical protein
MRIQGRRDLCVLGTALVVGSAITATAMTGLPIRGARAVTTVTVAMILAVSGLLAFTRGISGHRGDTIEGILATGAAWGIAAMIACGAPWQLLVALQPSMGPASVPTAIVAALCGTAGALLAGRWADVTLNDQNQDDTEVDRT